MTAMMEAVSMSVEPRTTTDAGTFILSPERAKHYSVKVLPLTENVFYLSILIFLN
jgi:hypothetical protein